MTVHTGQPRSDSDSNQQHRCLKILNLRAVKHFSNWYPGILSSIKHFLLQELNWCEKYVIAY